MKFLLGLLCVFGAVLLASSSDECLRACPFNYAPVCGSDGMTYGNKCAFEAANCEYMRKMADGTSLTIVNSGKC